MIRIYPFVRQIKVYQRAGEKSIVRQFNLNPYRKQVRSYNIEKPIWPLTIMKNLTLSLLQRAIEIAWHARAHGNHPFGALLADEDGHILLEAENTVITDKDCTAHAETNLVRLACQRYTPQFLSLCTLYTSTEPCAMCAGAIYWSGIGRVVYALSEAQLRQITANHPENPTLSLPCRQVFAQGQRPIIVEGPIELASAFAVHHGFWDKPRSSTDLPDG